MSHGGGDSGRWLVSYADLITLMMALFLVLYTMGQVDIERYRALAEAFREALNGGGGIPANIVDTGINTDGAGTGESRPNPVNPDEGFPPRTSDTMDVASDLTGLLEASGFGNSVSVQNNIEGVMLSLSENLLFEPSSADLSASASTVLDKIAVMLAPVANSIRVTAYTDDTPPTDPRYSTNWELSSARATAIVRYLAANGVNPEQLSATGRGEYDPIFPNTSDQNRAYNRRAEIAVIYTIESNNVVLQPEGADLVEIPSITDGTTTEGTTP
ncbi:MAG TPA: flagellar motor protein MotB [Anaerolineales bacterium]|nr:flagellar motor protein MotB [Anaerolineales bacterium]